MLVLSRPLRRVGDSAWTASLDVAAGGEWVRLGLRADDQSPQAASDLAFARAALSIAGALLAALAERDTSLGDAAELLARARSGDADAIDSVNTIVDDASDDDDAADALAGLEDARDARELLERASSGDADALEQLGQIAEDADAGDEQAQRAERALTTPALLGTPTLDLGTLELEDGPGGALQRLSNALEPAPRHVRGACLAMRAIHRSSSALTTGAA